VNAARSRPNIVYILTDEWRAHATGYNGDPNCETPVLDRLASESVSMTNAVSGCPVCCPARASILTGLYPLGHGVIINDVELDPRTPSIARLFSTAGYSTGYIGKWHVYGSPDGKFGRRSAYVPREYQLGFDYWKGFECTHDYNDSYYYFNDDPSPHRWDGYDAFAQADDAARFIRDRSTSDAPFLLMLSWGPPHFPLHTAPPKYRDRYHDRHVDLRPNVPEANRERAQEELRGYYAHIAALDDALRIVLGAIDETGIADNTIVIFTSDHGDMRQSQGLDTKLFPWDESIRVPFLMRWPARFGRAARSVPVPIDTPDHLPTLLGLCGIDIPSSVEGHDWSSVMSGNEPATGAEAALLIMAAEFTELRRNGMSAYRGLRTARHTYVRTRRGPWLLYDNEIDPYQMSNLIGRPGHADLQAQVDRQLSARLNEMNDPFEEGWTLIERAGLSHYAEANEPMARMWVDPWRPDAGA
jgi:arylsulfatase A-like enzyme